MSEQKNGGLLRMLQREYKQGEVVPASAIYECSECEGLTAFKQGEKFTHCADCPEKQEGQVWFRTDDFVHFVSKNLNTEFDRLETVSVRVAEFIATFAGNVWFVYFHVIWFALWIWLNTGDRIASAAGGFDPYPFPFLVLVVSLEAIFLSTFILIAQGLQSRKSELRADLDYQVNVKTEKDVAEVHALLSELHVHLMKKRRKR